MSALPISTPRRLAGLGAVPRALLPARVARLLAFAALASFGALHWAQLVVPARPQEALAVVGVGLVAGLLLPALGGARRGVRVAATLAALVVALVAALLAAGVPLALLAPRAWGDLAAGIGQGLSAVPSVRIPYRGLEEWSRVVLLSGGGALTALAAVLAFAPRRAPGRVGFPAAAVVVLAALYAIPAIQRPADAPLLEGLAFLLLLGAFLWLERVRRDSAPLAALLVVAAAVLALLTAPALDVDGPLIDYEAIAQSLSPPAASAYDWNHAYGPLDWPREGREVLRVRAEQSSYWKATNLDGFDGLRWGQAASRTNRGRDSQIEVDEREWFQTIRVTVRALESTEFIGAGTTLRISDSPRAALRTAPGTWATGRRPLRRGHAYRAETYVPRPSAEQLRDAPADYPRFVEEGLTMALPPTVGGPALRDEFNGRLEDGPPVGIFFPAFGSAQDGEAVAFARGRTLDDDGDALLQDSGYARTWALARRLRAASATPYEYVTAVQEHLAGERFTYTERPPVTDAPPLDGFLHDTQAGYCQQFSGAMALLLRMGGVPARIAAGFSPGALDPTRGEYVVRDVDAHSWVEAYFPGIGWVTFDPTPDVSPARSQATGIEEETAAGSGETGATAAPPERTGDPAALGQGAAAQEGGGTLPVWAGLAALGLLAALGSGVAALRGRRARGPGAREAPGPDAVSELRRALARSGHAPEARTTLDALAGRFAGTPAEGYVRALAAARYGGARRGPTRAQRAGLRRALAARGGPLGRVRAWWALPPRA